MESQIILLSLGTWQALSLSLIFIFLSNQSPSKKHLSLFFLFVGLHYLWELLWYSSPLGAYRWAEYLTLPTALAIAPLLHLYVLRLTGLNAQKTIQYWPHSIPSLAIFAIYCPLYSIMDSNHRSIYLLEKDLWSFIPRLQEYPAATVVLFSLIILIPLQILYYTWFSWRIIRKHQEALNHLFANPEQASLRWIIWMGVTFYLYQLFAWLVFLLGTIPERNYYGSSLFFFLGFGILALRQKENYPSDIVISNQDVDSSQPEQQATPSHNHSTNRWLDNLHVYFSQHEPWKNPDLTLFELARDMGTNKSYLSKAINHGLGMDFHQFVTNYRIAEAKRLLTDPISKQWSIEAISKSVGFSSTSSFFASFKKDTGLTPAVYRDQGQYTSGL